MPNPCPQCGGEMLDDTCQYHDKEWCRTQMGPCDWDCPVDGENSEPERIMRCAMCGYWDETTIQPDGTIDAVGHVPEEEEG